MTKIFGLLIVVFAFQSCSESNSESPDMALFGYDYMPIEVGNEWVYIMDSVVYDPEPGRIQVDTITQYVKFVVVDSIHRGGEGKAYKVERFISEIDSLNWQIQDVWSIEKSDKNLISNEENIDYIKLIFPLTERSSWDGNARINTSDVRVKVRGESLDMFKFWNRYQVINFQDTITIESIFYDDVVEIEHVNKEILIEKRLSTESYAKGVGLIYKKLAILDTQNDDESLLFEERAESGFIQEMRLISHK